MHVNDQEIARLRLRRQHLTGTPLATPEAVVSWLGAVQAQEFGVAKWSIAQRSRGQITNADLNGAMVEGRLLRTHLFRSTWHFVLPADLRWMLMLIAPRVRARMAPYCWREGLTDAVLKRSEVVLREALADGRQLVRSEISAAFTRGRIATDGLKLRLLLLRAELELVVCSGALRGKHQTFALADDFVPPAPIIPEEEALAELTRRYFSSHGPATLKDFIWWSSLTAAQARHGLELLKDKGLRRLEVGARTYWMLESATRRATSEAPVRMLQAFDEYIIGYTESRNVLAIAGKLDPPRGAPTHSNALIRDGQLIGFWRTTVTPEQALVEVHVARRLDATTQSALENELERFGRFLQLPVRLTMPKARSR